MKAPHLLDVAEIGGFGGAHSIPTLCRFGMPWPEFRFRVHSGVFLGELNKLYLARAIWKLEFAPLRGY